MKKIISICIMSLFLFGVVSAETFYGTDNSGKKFFVKINEIPNWLVPIYKFFSQQYGVVSPNTLERTQVGTATMYLTVSCPNNCQPTYISYSLWDSSGVNQGGGSTSVSGISCQTTQQLSFTFTVPLGMPIGQATIKAVLKGSGGCVASSEDSAVFTVGSPPPDCSCNSCPDGSSCVNNACVSSWSSCQGGFKTRTHFNSDCSSYIETVSCGTTTTTISGTTTTIQSGNCISNPTVKYIDCDCLSGSGNQFICSKQCINGQPSAISKTLTCNSPVWCSELPNTIDYWRAIDTKEEGGIYLIGVSCLSSPPSTTTTTTGTCVIDSAQCGNECISRGSTEARCEASSCPSGFTNIGDYSCTSFPPCSVCCCKSTGTTIPVTTTTISGCTCGGWIHDLGCNVAPCSANERKFTKDCNPVGCEVDYKCQVDTDCGGGCPSGTTLCSDGTCKADCGTPTCTDYCDGTNHYHSGYYVNDKCEYSKEDCLPGTCTGNACQGGTCPTCNEPSGWSTCIDGKQSRTAYICDASTNMQCKEQKQEVDCEDNTCPSSSEQKPCEDALWNDFPTCNWDDTTCSKNCITDANCASCSSKCVGGKCVELTNIPMPPCKEATWEDYPLCHWDSSKCPIPIPTWALPVAIAGIVGVVSYVIWTKKKW